MINVVARDRGWLFADLLRHFERIGREPQFSGKEDLLSDGPRVRSSEAADPSADAWIYIRTAEAVDSPDLSRTVVQIHDMWSAKEHRETLAAAGALCFTHPLQIPEDDGSDPAWVPWEPGEKFGRRMCRPIGALEAFFEVEHRPSDTFTVGWIGRPFVKDGRDLKRLDLFVETIKALGPPCRVLIVGENLEWTAANIGHERDVPVVLFRREEHTEPWEECGPFVYSALDALVATSESQAVPLPVFEAIAAGVPVVSTPRGWPGQAWLLHNGDETAEDLAKSIRSIRDHPNTWAQMAEEKRQELVDSGYTLESWIEENLRLAAGLVP